MTTTQNQIVQVNVKTNDEKKRRKKKKYAKRRTTQNTYERTGLQASAYQQPAAPNRPYIPLTNYIASPYNNGLVPEVFTIKQIALQTLEDMRKYVQTQFEYGEKQTAKIEEFKDDVKFIKQAMSSHGSQKPTSNEYSQYPSPPSSAYDDLASQRTVASQTSASQNSVASQSSLPSSLMNRFMNMSIHQGRRTLDI